MNKIQITGASCRTSVDGIGEWMAVYICHKCGEEFAYAERCRCEEEARDSSLTNFDVQQRRYCYRCGYKLTTKNDIPENEYIAALNGRIDDLEANRRGLITKLLLLRDDPPVYHDDDVTVNAFAAAMKEKLAKARENGRNGWQDISAEELSCRVANCVLKGNPIDVANYCMFLWALGARIAFPSVTEFRRETP